MMILTQTLIWLKLHMHLVSFNCQQGQLWTCSWCQQPDHQQG